MPIPSYGAAPLSKTFALVRMIQVVAMVCIVGLAANFVSEIVSSYMEPPKEFVGTLSIVSVICYDDPRNRADMNCRLALQPFMSLLAWPSIGLKQI